MSVITSENNRKNKTGKLNKLKAIIMTMIALLFLVIALVRLGVIDLKAIERNISSSFAAQPQWDEQVAKITDKDLLGWLKKAPFNNLYYPAESNKGKMVMTNAEQVFPFMGNFMNGEGKLQEPPSEQADIYQDNYVIYKDPEFGELFLYAALTYQPMELFVSQSAMALGNPFFSGMSATSEHYSAGLKQTQVFSKTADYKTAIYIADGSKMQSAYLFAVYQRANLGLQVGIPLTSTNTEQVITKLKEVNRALGLNVAEWQALKADNLAISEDTASFWQDPYYGLSIKKPLLPDLYLRLALTPFAEMNWIAATEKGFDYYFAYTAEQGEVELGVTVKDTTLSREDYFAEHASTPTEYMANKDYNDEHKVFVEETRTGDTVSGTAETYFKDNSILQLHYSYPLADKQAEGYTEDILANIKISIF